MNKILSFKVLNSRGRWLDVEADEFHIQGEYVQFFYLHTPEEGVTAQIVEGADAGVRLATLPARRLLTVLHRPQEITPVWEE